MAGLTTMRHALRSCRRNRKSLSAQSLSLLVCAFEAWERPALRTCAQTSHEFVDSFARCGLRYRLTCAVGAVSERDDAISRSRHRCGENRDCQAGSKDRQTERSRI